jgi:hypothetical protein
MRRLLLLLAAATFAFAVAAPTASASRSIRYGVQDDAWLMHGPGSLQQRVATLDDLGVDLVRFTVRWDQVARKRPRNGRSHLDPAYKWATADAVLRELRAHGITPVVTLLGTPRWANRGRSFAWAPTSGAHFANFAFAAQRRYMFVRDWLIWNEPNQRRWLRPTSPSVYVSRLLNPAYAAIKKARRSARVAGGVTAPRGSTGGVSPLRWIRGMDKARARLDAYAHHPYPLRPRTETPWSGGCAHCETITMATLERLIREVGRAFGRKRIWLTEYGYQTNPPDRALGVSPTKQARYLGEASLRAYRAPYVDMLVAFMVRDDAYAGGWQSGLFTRTGVAKLSAKWFPLPLAQSSRRGTRTVVWGQIRPGSGRQTYRLRMRRGGRWLWVGGTRRTNSRGFFSVALRAGRGTSVQVWHPRSDSFGSAIVVR